MRGLQWPPGLPVRFAVTVALVAFIAALIVSIPTFLFSRSYLIEQRETSALSRALVDSNAIDVALSEGEPPGEALVAVPSVGDSQAMLQVGDEWFTQGVTVSPDDLPPDLLTAAAQHDGAMQRFAVENGDPYLGIAIPVTGGMYVEVFPLAELDDALTLLSILLAAGSIAALLPGAILGAGVGSRILRPLRDMAGVATRITDGDLAARVSESSDPDLGPIATAFNNMAATVESRLERERRFSANVSHELRSPLTGILGTAELLESRKEDLPAREETLIGALVSQVRRFSGLVLDLLELSQIGGDSDVLPDMVDIGALARFVVSERDKPAWMVRGDATARTDPRRLERILANLVDNADKHGEGLRQITIARGDGRTEIMVDDRGPGVREEDRARIFEPFNRGGKTDRTGSGLGLTIVSEQARLIGGTVLIEDAPNGGARFLVSFRDLPIWGEEGQ